MLYLNPKPSKKSILLFNLTLTNVVFELAGWVHEEICQKLFNFNKCCIWIIFQDRVHQTLAYLTLTNVVFELNSFI